MKVTLSQENDISVISIEGSIDGKTAPLVRQEMYPTLETAMRVVLDLSKVDYLSSAGLRLLLLVYREFAAKQGKLVLLGVSEDIQTVMSHTGFLNFFKLAGSMPEALQAVS
ncbi:MAG: anti-sigma B factor antagonist [Acidobacteria bacterium]|nr:MAG: anti-sigma B factor antagonist [Acidobacteriota bacterium]